MVSFQLKIGSIGVFVVQQTIGPVEVLESIGIGRKGKKAIVAGQPESAGLVL